MFTMEDEPSILSALLDDDGEGDIEMVDVEEGQLFEQTTDSTAEGNNNVGEPLDAAMNAGKKKRKKNRKKKKKQQQPSNGPAPPVEINRFVIDTCRRLTEKKSYLVYSAVGTLGVEALSDLVREVDAIQYSVMWRTDDCRWQTFSNRWWDIMEHLKGQRTCSIQRNSEASQGL